MILVQKWTRKDQRPLGRTVQLRRRLHEIGSTARICDLKSNRYSIEKSAFCLHICESSD